MYCSNCGKQTESTARFCASCGSSLHDIHSIPTIQTGQDSINIGVGNLPNANIHIGDKIQLTEEPIVYQLDRTNDVRTPIKALWVFIAGAVNFLAALLELMTNLGVKIPLLPDSPIFMAFAALLMFIGLILLRHRFVWLQFFGIETDLDGYIHFTNLKGICPKCGSTLSVRYVGPKDAKELIALCSRNPEKHRFTFDPTELPDIEGKNTIT